MFSIPLTLNAAAASEAEATATVTRWQLLAYTSPLTPPPPAWPATELFTRHDDRNHSLHRRTSTRAAHVSCSARVGAAGGSGRGSWVHRKPGGAGRAGDLRPKIRYPVAWRRVGTLVFREMNTGRQPYSFLVVFFCPFAIPRRSLAAQYWPPLSRHQSVGPRSPLPLPKIRSPPPISYARDNSRRSAISSIERR